jgi:hypothetical protein
MNERFQRLTLAGLLALSLIAVGCSKKEAAEAEPAVDADGKTAAAPVKEKDNAEAGQAISSVGSALQKNDFDAAIGALLQAQQTQGAMSEAQKQQYAQSVRDTTTRLLEASRTDPKAAEAYANFGRLMTGR